MQALTATVCEPNGLDIALRYTAPWMAMTGTLGRTGEMAYRKEPTGDGKSRRRRPKNEGTTGSQKVSDELMAFLVGEGYSGPEIVRILKDDYGIDYTRAGVSYWRRRHNAPVRTRTKSAEELVPWRVLQEDDSHRLLRFLRTEARIRENLPVDYPNAVRHASVARELRATKGVIYYDHENGFAIVPPRPGIDKDLIFDPRIADDGSPIDDKALWQ